MTHCLVYYCPILLYCMAGACAALMVIERLGAPTTLSLTFKGDVKRETRWLAQYGQAVCTAVAAVLVWRLDPSRAGGWLVVGAPVLIVSLVAMLLKRLLGRVRPRRENAGKFVGPTLSHANFRESFPSSHSASALALSVSLSMLYPRGAVVFWALALICAVLRYIMDAHWPSDVLGGLALGYGLSHLTLHYMKLHHVINPWLI
jgi:membrane-associated phospholipid phosphatase